MAPPTAAMGTGSNTSTASPKVLKALSVSSSSSDPSILLDALNKSRGASTAAGASVASFDAIDFLNTNYSSEAALVSHLPGLREAVSERMEKLDDRISNALQRQSETAEATRRHVQDAKASVVALENRIRQVKEKASQSEKAVLEITSDMKRLDCAKRHLQRTITTLKRLHMLVHAVEQLRQTCQMKPFPDYKTASHLVDATQLLLQHFEAYTQKVQPMRVLSQKVKDYEEELLVSLVRGFRVVAFGISKAIEMESVSKKRSATVQPFDENQQTMPPDVMQGGVLLVQALGSTSRNEFIHDFCQDQLGDYLQNFQPPSREVKPEKRVSSFKVVEAKPEPEKSPASLDMVERRFAWFRTLVQGVELKFPEVFPASWNLQAAMSSIFLQLTRDHILALLDGPRKDPDAKNATILLKALQKTIMFEKDITAWLQRERGAVFETDDDAAGHNDDTQARLKPLIGIASGAFESYMDPYIRLEEQSMDEQLVEALDDKTVDTRGERPVFISSTNLFVYIKGSIARCTALSKGNMFLLLCHSFKDSFRKYVQILDGKLPSAIAAQSGVVGGISIPGTFVGVGGKQEKSNNDQYRIQKGEETTVCHVISTCEYCADTLEALEDLIRETIDDKFKSKVDLMADQEAFHDLAAKCIRVLVSGLTNRMEPALRTMAALNWGVWDAVGDESQYIEMIQQELEPFIRATRELLPTSYFRSFCDKFAVAFGSAYYTSIIRLKRINEPGTQQLLLDVYNLKTLFLKLPVLEKAGFGGKKPSSSGSTIAPAMYTKMVNKQFGRIETLLKLVGTPTDMLIDNFKVQWPGGTTTDLQNVMSLRGLKRAEQTAMLEKFGVKSTGAGAALDRVQALQDQGSKVADKVNSDLNQMRQKVDEFRKSFR